MTRRGFMLYNVLLGLSLAGVVTLGVFVVSDIHRRASANHAAIERLDRLTNALRGLTNPTPAEFRRQLRAGLRRCLAEPECRRLFPRVARRSTGSRSAGTSSGQSRPLSPRPGSSAGSRERQGGQADSGEDPRPTPPKPTPRPSSPGSGSGSSPGPSPTPPSSPPPPSIAAPAVPAKVCTPVLGINC